MHDLFRDVTVWCPHCEAINETVMDPADEDFLQAPKRGIGHSLIDCLNCATGHPKHPRPLRWQSCDGSIFLLSLEHDKR